MTVIMFWNICRQPIYEAIAAACRENDVDVLILAECELSSVALLGHLNAGVTSVYYEPPGVPQRISFFVRYSPGRFEAMSDDSRFGIRKVRPPIGPEFLLVAAHLPSKLHARDADHSLHVETLVREIEQQEELAGHSSTLLIGDLNQNPFETPMIAANLLHSVMDRSIADRLHRTVAGRQFKFFYNPMWGRLGDDSIGPPGTYFYTAGAESFFWNTFDQVLLRPNLLPYYSSSDLRVLTKVGSSDLLKDGRIDATFSDHLPIILRLNFERSAEFGRELLGGSREAVDENALIDTV
jgi:hypothetical protein